jgi:thermolysin
VAAFSVLVVAQPPQKAGGTGLNRLLATSGSTLREWDSRLASMERDHELRLRTVQVDTLVPGRTHERFDQYYQGVPVFGGEAIRETDGQITLSVTASIYSGISIATTPALSDADAAKAFQAATGASPGTRVSCALMVLPRADGSYVLAYRVSAFVNRQAPVVFVNAQSGAVERRYNNLQRQQPTALVGSGVLAAEGLVASDLKKVSCALQGSTYLAFDMMRPLTIKTYDLKGAVARVDQLVAGMAPFLQSDLASSTGPTWQDSVVVDGHTYIGWTYDYYYHRQNWKGLDGNNVRSMSVIVHPANRADLTSYNWADVAVYYADSFFCGQCGSAGEDLAVFGEGLPAGWYDASTNQYIDYFVASLDTVAHEYSHGVTTYTSNLIYQDESGALDEAFSDIMGTSTKFFFEPAGSGLLQADYRMSKEIFRPVQPGGPYGDRDLSNPLALGDPDNYSIRYLGTDDNGGVHTNSTIASYAFYLAIEGGTDHTSGLSVAGVGAAHRDQIEKVFFRGFTTLVSNASFSLARATTIQAARDLYGTGSSAETAVTQAWNAVGVN